jgi:hypothetical protein
MAYVREEPFRPILVVNPATDRAFRDFAEDAVQRLERSAPAELQRKLRARYPDAVARARDLHGESAVVWYVYRDGHWVMPWAKSPPSH